MGSQASPLANQFQNWCLIKDCEVWENKEEVIYATGSVVELNKMQIDGKSIIEVCASPLTANAHPHHDENNSTRIHDKTTDTQHFGVLQLKLVNATEVQLKTGLYDSNGTVLFSHRETL